MFQNQKRTKLKINLENNKQHKKNPLKLHKIEERNKEKMDLIQEKINFIHEKLSLFKDSVSSKNKTITRRFEIKMRESLTGLERDALSMYFKDKKRPNSMYFDIFIRGFGISIIDTTPQEVFYISLYNMRVKYISNVLILSPVSSKTYSLNK